MTLAFVFPGQGSQSVGMGKDLYDNFSVAKDVFNEVDEAVCFKLSSLMFEGDMAELTKTVHAQPAIMATSMAALKVIEKETGKNIQELASFVAGHSLGEYGALCAAGALSLFDTAKLLKARGEYMQEASLKNPGAMAAVLGLSLKEVNELVNKACDETKKCYIANDNCQGQVVISGHKEAIEKAALLAPEMGAKKCVILPVSGGFHSPLMEEAAVKMQEELVKTNLVNPVIPVISNVTAEAETNADKIKELLVAQVTGSVRWTESVSYMQMKGVTDFVECGNGKVLTGLIKRIVPDARLLNVGTKDQVEQALSFF
ncbi:MAG: ACP S-malonyltransferase [Alphaproteobacteria bacterium]|nr:ACP S-malonyltransferase [Alphaproteobacteria bacterium]